MTAPVVSEGPIATHRLTLHALRSCPQKPEGRVLLLGGSNFDLRLKRQFLDTQLARRFEILTYEPRGIGRSGQPQGSWSMADYAADAVALMDAVGWERADVLGESFGGMTALHLARKSPERVARLAVASATAGGAGGGSADIARLLDLPRRLAASEALKLLDTENIEFEATDPEVFEARVSKRMEFDKTFAEPSVSSGGYRHLLAARADHNIWDGLQDITQNTIVITGTRDAQAPRKAQDAMAEQLPNAVQWVYECGHGVAFATARPMQDFCGVVGASGTGSRDVTQVSALVIGLGSMGFGMAQSCLRAGITTRGVDVNPEAEARFSALGGQAGNAREDAGTLDAVVVVVLNAAQLEAVLFGPEGIVPHLRRGAVVIACPTVAPAVARDMAARCAETGVFYLDAPISGGAVKAAEGALSIMASGSPEAFAAARPLLDATAAKVFELGPDPGAGSAMKAVNQLLAGVHIAAMGEAMAFGMTQGVTPDAFLEVISQCAGTSWMLENRAPHVVDGDYSPRSQINIWPKDLGIVLDIAKDAGFSAPITATALQQYMVAVGMGLGAEDDAAITKVYARNAGLDLPGSGD